ncbi:hypothetical protein IT400_01865 [Candidatus Nomurabacteria bacterium]|nr:hypothetical protein [Candidatus Nomurabacteria bacterium]
MKYFIFLIIIVVYLFPKPFVTYPGYTTEKIYNEWETTKKTCYGYAHVTPRADEDAEEKSWCIGMVL